MKAWIGVDLDGTLAEYDGWDGGKIGAPIPAMVERIKEWLEKGEHDVRIFTARVGPNAFVPIEMAENTRARTIQHIQTWLKEEAGLPGLQVTATKDFAMIELWDDRAVQVVRNTGERVGDIQP